MATVSVQTEDFELSSEIEKLKANNHNIGAIVSFTGTVRDVTGDLESMTLEHYPGMTDKELQRIALKAEERWPLEGCCIIHRYGTLAPGDNIVLVITASKHRRAAFDSAAFIMDFLKTRATFWKKEKTPDGDEWVDARDSDTQTLNRWK